MERVPLKRRRRWVEIGIAGCSLLVTPGQGACMFGTVWPCPPCPLPAEQQQQQQQQQQHLVDQRHTHHHHQQEQEQLQLQQQQQWIPQRDHHHHDHQHRHHRHGTLPFSASLYSLQTPSSSAAAVSAQHPGGSSSNDNRNSHASTPAATTTTPTLASSRRLVVEVEAHLHSAVGDWGECSPDTCTQSRPVVCETRDSKIVPDHLCGDELPEAVRACAVADDANACNPPSSTTATGAAKAATGAGGAVTGTPTSNASAENQKDDAKITAADVANGGTKAKVFVPTTDAGGGVSNHGRAGGGGDTAAAAAVAAAAAAAAPPPKVTVGKSIDSRGGDGGSSTSRSRGETAATGEGDNAAATTTKVSTVAEKAALPKRYQQGEGEGTTPAEEVTAGEEKGVGGVQEAGGRTEGGGGAGMGGVKEAGGEEGAGGGVRGADYGVVSPSVAVPEEAVASRGSASPRQNETQEELHPKPSFAIHQDMGRLGSGPGPSRAEYRFWTVLAIGAGAVGSFLAVVVFAVGQYRKEQHRMRGIMALNEFPQDNYINPFARTVSEDDRAAFNL